jgi:hypothetical protein
MSLVNKILKESSEQPTEEQIPKTDLEALRISCLKDPEKIDIDIVAKILFFQNHPLTQNVEQITGGIERGCYYNALAFAKKNNCDVAWGIIIPANHYSNYREWAAYYSYIWDLTKESQFPTIYGVVHAFCVSKDKIIETSPIKDISNRMYAYEVVPRELWEKFNYKENDEDFDAEDFANYVYEKWNKIRTQAQAWVKKNIK